MRCVAPALVIAAISLLCPGEIQAKIYTMGTKPQAYAAPTKSRWGHCHRKGQDYATAATGEQVESLIIPCPPDQAEYASGRRPSHVSRHMDALRRRIHHELPHCAQCYNGGPVCSCCDHPNNILKPGTPKYLFYKALIRTGLIETF